MKAHLILLVDADADAARDLLQGSTHTGHEARPLKILCL